jgi:hypothetical protein
MPSSLPLFLPRSHTPDPPLSESGRARIRLALAALIVQQDRQALLGAAMPLKNYITKTPADFQKVMDYWHKRTYPLLIFYCIKTGSNGLTACFTCHTPFYIVEHSSPVETPEQAVDLFGPLAKARHTFVRHGRE